MARTLVIVLGPTAVGKTSWSIDKAIQVGSPIISCDSRQIFQNMSIGTAVPSQRALSALRHYFIQTVPVTSPFTAGDYERQAVPLIESLFDQGHETLVVTGGSMFYIDAIVNGLDDFPETDPSLRQSLWDRVGSEGLEALAESLRQKDPLTYSQIDIRNPQRVIRALLPYRNCQALQTVGYKEMFGYLDGKYPLEEAVRLIQRNTRHYAKRQLTWWRRDPDIKWVEL